MPYLETNHRIFPRKLGAHNTPFVTAPAGVHRGAPGCIGVHRGAPGCTPETLVSPRHPRPKFSSNPKPCNEIFQTPTPLQLVWFPPQTTFRIYHHPKLNPNESTPPQAISKYPITPFSGELETTVLIHEDSQVFATLYTFMANMHALPFSFQNTTPTKFFTFVCTPPGTMATPVTSYPQHSPRQNWGAPH